MRHDFQFAPVSAPSPRAGAKAFRRGSSPAEMWGPGPSFSEKTMLVLKAACAQYLGRYPCKTPTVPEVKAVLKEMARMQGDWKKGLEGMSVAFRNISEAIKQVENYAWHHGILPRTQKQ